MTLAVLTPTYRPDYELCVDLVRSVRQHFPAGTEHHLVVPAEDVSLFSKLGVAVHAEHEFLPRSFLRVRGSKYDINLRMPLPPVRGWIRQQILKLAAANSMQVDTVVVVDSDIIFVRPVTEATFRHEGKLQLYASPGAVGSDKIRHVKWHRAARALLGLPLGQPPYDDYVSSLVAWDPTVVRAALKQVEASTHMRWSSAVGARLHFSEWTLYGVFAEQYVPDGHVRTIDSLCHDYWDTLPLSEAEASSFVAERKESDVAVMISAKSRTPVAVRRAAWANAALAPWRSDG